ncbi:Calcium-dependent protein kinase 4 [Seminavis robusta]|uniref:Calcium-dependent protein kinase 4 n=1 Tax=Seminavis robusta TaxID=568900 RepID=A0A9N8DTN6_9STRA|nr:Calcium-dependent protein kinase 4 [Seminavis robusta]|eukprot:Sro363_g126830.1 Calcium-dependent protein kinase 4 (3826) ;mRNA; r:4686-16436
MTTEFQVGSNVDIDIDAAVEEADVRRKRQRKRERDRQHHQQQQNVEDQVRNYNAEVLVDQALNTLKQTLLLELPLPVSVPLSVPMSVPLQTQRGQHNTPDTAIQYGANVRSFASPDHFHALPPHAQTNPHPQQTHNRRHNRGSNAGNGNQPTTTTTTTFTSNKHKKDNDHRHVSEFNERRYNHHDRYMYDSSRDDPYSADSEEASREPSVRLISAQTNQTRKTAGLVELYVNPNQVKRICGFNVIHHLKDKTNRKVFRQTEKIPPYLCRLDEAGPWTRISEQKRQQSLRALNFIVEQKQWRPVKRMPTVISTKQNSKHMPGNLRTPSSRHYYTHHHHRYETPPLRHIYHQRPQRQSDGVYPPITPHYYHSTGSNSHQHHPHSDLTQSLPVPLYSSQLYQPQPPPQQTNTLPPPPPQQQPPHSHHNNIFTQPTATTQPTTTATATQAFPNSIAIPSLQWDPPPPILLQTPTATATATDSNVPVDTNPTATNASQQPHLSLNNFNQTTTTTTTTTLDPHITETIKNPEMEPVNEQKQQQPLHKKQRANNSNNISSNNSNNNNDRTTNVKHANQPPAYMDVSSLAGTSIEPGMPTTDDPSGIVVVVRDKAATKLQRKTRSSRRSTVDAPEQISTRRAANDASPQQRSHQSSQRQPSLASLSSPKPHATKRQAPHTLQNKRDVAAMLDEKQQQQGPQLLTDDDETLQSRQHNIHEHLQEEAIKEDCHGRIDGQASERVSEASSSSSGPWSAYIRLQQQKEREERGKSARRQGSEDSSEQPWEAYIRQQEMIQTVETKARKGTATVDGTSASSADGIQRKKQEGASSPSQKAKPTATRHAKPEMKKQKSNNLLDEYHRLQEERVAKGKSDSPRMSRAKAQEDQSEQPSEDVVSQQPSEPSKEPRQKYSSKDHHSSRDQLRKPGPPKRSSAHKVAPPEARKSSTTTKHRAHEDDDPSEQPTESTVSHRTSESQRRQSDASRRRSSTRKHGTHRHHPTDEASEQPSEDLSRSRQSVQRAVTKPRQVVAKRHPTTSTTKHVNSKGERRGEPPTVESPLSSKPSPWRHRQAGTEYPSKPPLSNQIVVPPLPDVIILRTASSSRTGMDPPGVEGEELFQQHQQQKQLSERQQELLEKQQQWQLSMLERQQRQLQRIQQNQQVQQQHDQQQRQIQQQLQQRQHLLQEQQLQQQKIQQQQFEQQRIQQQQQQQQFEQQRLQQQQQLEQQRIQQQQQLEQQRIQQQQLKQQQLQQREQQLRLQQQAVMAPSLPPPTPGGTRNLDAMKTPATHKRKLNKWDTVDQPARRLSPDWKDDEETEKKSLARIQAALPSNHSNPSSKHSGESLSQRHAPKPSAKEKKEMTETNPREQGQAILIAMAAPATKAKPRKDPYSSDDIDMGESTSAFADNGFVAFVNSNHSSTKKTGRGGTRSPIAASETQQERLGKMSPQATKVKATQRRSISWHDRQEPIEDRKPAAEENTTDDLLAVIAAPLRNNARRTYSEEVSISSGSDVSFDSATRSISENSDILNSVEGERSNRAQRTAGSAPPEIGAIRLLNHSGGSTDLVSPVTEAGVGPSSANAATVDDRLLQVMAAPTTPLKPSLAGQSIDIDSGSEFEVGSYTGSLSENDSDAGPACGPSKSKSTQAACSLKQTNDSTLTPTRANKSSPESGLLRAIAAPTIALKVQTGGDLGLDYDSDFDVGSFDGSLSEGTVDSAPIGTDSIAAHKPKQETAQAAVRAKQEPKEPHHSQTLGADKATPTKTMLVAEPAQTKATAKLSPRSAEAAQTQENQLLAAIAAPTSAPPKTPNMDLYDSDPDFDVGSFTGSFSGHSDRSSSPPRDPSPKAMSPAGSPAIRKNAMAETHTQKGGVEPNNVPANNKDRILQAMATPAKKEKKGRNAFDDLSIDSGSNMDLGSSVDLSSDSEQPVVVSSLPEKQPTPDVEHSPNPARKEYVPKQIQFENAEEKKTHGARVLQAMASPFACRQPQRQPSLYDLDDDSDFDETGSDAEIGSEPSNDASHGNNPGTADVASIQSAGEAEVPVAVADPTEAKPDDDLHSDLHSDIHSVSQRKRKNEPSYDVLEAMADPTSLDKPKPVPSSDDDVESEISLTGSVHSVKAQKEGTNNNAILNAIAAPVKRTADPLDDLSIDSASDFGSIPDVGDGDVPASSPPPIQETETSILQLRSPVQPEYSKKKLTFANKSEKAAYNTSVLAAMAAPTVKPAAAPQASKTRSAYDFDEDSDFEIDSDFDENSRDTSSSSNSHNSWDRHGESNKLENDSDEKLQGHSRVGHTEPQNQAGESNDIGEEKSVDGGMEPVQPQRASTFDQPSSAGAWSAFESDFTPEKTDEALNANVSIEKSESENQPSWDAWGTDPFATAPSQAETEKHEKKNDPENNPSWDAWTEDPFMKAQTTSNNDKEEGRAWSPGHDEPSRVGRGDSASNGEPENADDLSGKHSDHSGLPLEHPAPVRPKGESGSLPSIEALNPPAGLAYAPGATSAFSAVGSPIQSKTEGLMKPDADGNTDHAEQNERPKASRSTGGSEEDPRAKAYALLKKLEDKEQDSIASDSTHSRHSSRHSSAHSNGSYASSVVSPAHSRQSSMRSNSTHSGDLSPRSAPDASKKQLVSTELNLDSKGDPLNGHSSVGSRHSPTHSDRSPPPLNDEPGVSPDDSSADSIQASMPSSIDYKSPSRNDSKTVLVSTQLSLKQKYGAPMNNEPEVSSVHSSDNSRHSSLHSSARSRDQSPVDDQSRSSRHSAQSESGPETPPTSSSATKPRLNLKVSRLRADPASEPEEPAVASEEPTSKPGPYGKGKPSKPRLTLKMTRIGGPEQKTEVITTKPSAPSPSNNDSSGSENSSRAEDDGSGQRSPSFDEGSNSGTDGEHSPAPSTSSKPRLTLKMTRIGGPQQTTEVISRRQSSSPMQNSPSQSSRGYSGSDHSSRAGSGIDDDDGSGQRSPSFDEGSNSGTDGEHSPAPSTSSKPRLTLKMTRIGGPEPKTEVIPRRQSSSPKQCSPSQSSRGYSESDHSSRAGSGTDDDDGSGQRSPSFDEGSNSGTDGEHSPTPSPSSKPRLTLKMTRIGGPEQRQRAGSGTDDDDGSGQRSPSFDEGSNSGTDGEHSPTPSPSSKPRLTLKMTRIGGPERKTEVISRRQSSSPKQRSPSQSSKCYSASDHSSRAGSGIDDDGSDGEDMLSPAEQSRSASLDEGSASEDGFSGSDASDHSGRSSPSPSPPPSKPRLNLKMTRVGAPATETVDLSRKDLENAPNESHSDFSAGSISDGGSDFSGNLSASERSNVSGGGSFDSGGDSDVSGDVSDGGGGGSTVSGDFSDGASRSDRSGGVSDGGSYASKRSRSVSEEGSPALSPSGKPRLNATMSRIGGGSEQDEHGGEKSQLRRMISHDQNSKKSGSVASSSISDVSEGVKSTGSRLSVAFAKGVIADIGKTFMSETGPMVSEGFEDYNAANHAIENFKHFKEQPGLKQAILSLVATVLMSLEEKDVLDEIFHAIDRDNDGKLSREDFRYGMQEFCGVDCVSENELRKLFWRLGHHADDLAEFVEYSEFIIGACDKSNMLSGEALQQAFSALDVDKDGFISADELKGILPNSGDMIQKIIARVDLDGDGMLSFGEFLSMVFKSARVQANTKEHEWRKVVQDPDPVNTSQPSLAPKPKQEREWKYKTAPNRPSYAGDEQLAPKKQSKALVSELKGKIPRIGGPSEDDDGEYGYGTIPEMGHSENSDSDDSRYMNPVQMPGNVMDQLKQAQSNLADTLHHVTEEEMQRKREIEKPLIDELKGALVDLKDHLRHVTEEEKERPAIPDRPYITELRHAQATVLKEWSTENYQYWI